MLYWKVYEVLRKIGIKDPEKYVETNENRNKIGRDCPPLKIRGKNFRIFKIEPELFIFPDAVFTTPEYYWPPKVTAPDTDNAIYINGLKNDLLYNKKLIKVIDKYIDWDRTIDDGKNIWLTKLEMKLDEYGRLVINGEVTDAVAPPDWDGKVKIFKRPVEIKTATLCLQGKVSFNNILTRDMINELNKETIINKLEENLLNRIMTDDYAGSKYYIAYVLISDPVIKRALLHTDDYDAWQHLISALQPYTAPEITEVIIKNKSVRGEISFAVDEIFKKIKNI